MNFFSPRKILNSQVSYLEISLSLSLSVGMAMNHHFSPDIPPPIWWTQQDSSQFQRSFHPPATEAVAAIKEVFMTAEKEHMFEKTLTPSDVGKLNRLVIPKQHAEKYFPLAGGSTSNSGVDSGLLLCFGDESGKSWRFRYSYWNSSQSYVLTKGWSRYVKEKGLDAGDVVMFERLKVDNDCMLIGFRRRMAAAHPSMVADNVSCVCHPVHASYPSPSTFPYQPLCIPAGVVEQSQTTPSRRNSKILRLFGVNLECQPKSSENNVPVSLSHAPSVLSQSDAYFQQYPTKNNRISYPQNYMEYNLSGDANQMRYHQG